MSGFIRYTDLYLHLDPCKYCLLVVMLVLSLIGSIVLVSVSICLGQGWVNCPLSSYTITNDTFSSMQSGTILQPAHCRAHFISSRILSRPTKTYKITISEWGHTWDKSRALFWSGLVKMSSWNQLLSHIRSYHLVAEIVRARPDWVFTVRWSEYQPICT